MRFGFQSTLKYECFLEICGFKKNRFFKLSSTLYLVTSPLVAVLLGRASGSTLE